MISLAPFTFFASLEPQMQAALGLALLLLAAVAARLLALWVIAPSLQRLAAFEDVFLMLAALCALAMLAARHLNQPVPRHPGE